MSLNLIKQDPPAIHIHADSELNLIKNIKEVTFPRSGTRWTFGPLFEGAAVHTNDMTFQYLVSEVKGLCIATQVEGPNPGLRGLARLRMQIPSELAFSSYQKIDPEDITPTDDDEEVITDVDTMITSSTALAMWERLALVELTRKGCTCTPRLLEAEIFKQNKTGPFPGGTFHINIMEIVPGHDLNNFDQLSIPERDEIRLAFAKSIREFFSFGYQHGDPGRRNLVWDRINRKIYIVDLEYVYLIEKDSSPFEFVPERDWYRWQLMGPSIMPKAHGVDPMVPCEGERIEDPGDEVLQQWAAEAAGKGLKKWGSRT